jgi:hypothetical protein
MHARTYMFMGIYGCHVFVHEFEVSQRSDSCYHGWLFCRQLLFTVIFFSSIIAKENGIFFFSNMELVSQFCVPYNTVNSENWWRASDWIIYSILMLFFETEQYFMYLKWVNTFLKFSSLMHRWPWPILAILFRPFGFIAPKTLN